MALGPATADQALLWGSETGDGTDQPRGESAMSPKPKKQIVRSSLRSQLTHSEINVGLQRDQRLRTSVAANPSAMCSKG